jgi:putative transposase
MFTYVEHGNTSKEYSRCGSIGIREGKVFKCGQVDHADANSSFNIALRPPLMEGIGQLHIDRDVCKGSTDTPRGATPRTIETPEPPKL